MIRRCYAQTVYCVQFRTQQITSIRRSLRRYTAATLYLQYGGGSYCRQNGVAVSHVHTGWPKKVSSYYMIKKSY